RAGSAGHSAQQGAGWRGDGVSFLSRAASVQSARGDRQNGKGVRGYRSFQSVSKRPAPRHAWRGGSGTAPAAAGAEASVVVSKRIALLAISIICVCARAQPPVNQRQFRLEELKTPPGFVVSVYAWL